MHGRYHVSVEGHPGAGASRSCATASSPNFYAEAERRHLRTRSSSGCSRPCRCPRSGHVRPWPGPRARQFLDPAVVARLGHARPEGADDRRGLPHRAAPQPVQGVQRRVRRVPAVPARRRSRARSTGRSTRAATATTSRSSRRRPTSTCHLLLDVSALDGLRLARASPSSNTASYLAALARLPDEPAARRRRADRLRRSDSSACCRRARGRATCARCCVALERLQLGSAAERRQAAAASWPRPSASAAWSCSSPTCSTIPSTVIDGLKHFRYPRHRRRRVPRARSARADVPVRAGGALSRSRDAGRGGGRARHRARATT